MDDVLFEVLNYYNYYNIHDDAEDFSLSRGGENLRNYVFKKPIYHIPDVYLKVLF